MVPKRACLDGADIVVTAAQGACTVLVAFRNVHDDALFTIRLSDVDHA